MIVLIASGALSLAFTLFLTPAFIKLFRKLEWGQFIRDDGPKSHHSKRGTATMGGIIIILGVLFGYFTSVLLAGQRPSISVLLVLFMMVGMGIVGFVDDFLKTRNQRSLGLGGWAKVLGQVIVASIFGVLAVNFPTEAANGNTPANMTISFIRDLPINFMALSAFGAIGVVVAYILYFIWINFIVAGTTNGVNVTDGLDGLATGASILALSAYILIGFWQSIQSCYSTKLDPANISKCYEVRDPLALAVIATAVAGALIGFLWWNTSPAQIFLGDTGSLALGGVIAALAILSHTELLLVLIGGLFVIETGSVIVQRAYFKLTHGRRIFLMSPIHHHFELKGWAEVTVVVRFWIVAGLLIAAAVGIFYLEWLTH
ncbi:phospho-N-acetylmuramoyl-pentapeptide-transferase [Microbacterium sp. STN6]|uniref:phospho-N-acetylmuramoyl-pentapeptide- transferase n=1 Tax=Microbacterium sp. STN6 TaxID=2995588 RepID=UPI0022610013|nr:phospho-N-acetylmuramoyl-pentapeptide-transferase [Microbacterium sp. STN6]MCX7521508.1 phospho-N-acetylmuramoyl-pentapeptide-transferase [Microbacterium sp. STN6]